MASPKSATLSVSEKSSSKFAGLRSRCSTWFGLGLGLELGLGLGLELGFGLVRQEEHGHIAGVGPHATLARQ